MNIVKKHRKWVLSVWLLAAGMVMLAGCGKKTDSETGGGETAEVHWLTDWEEAKQTAQAENKDLLINFSGSDWCYWCKRLDAEVFSKARFVQPAQDDFVFVMLDFPSDTSDQSESLQRQNERLSQEFGVQGFPTVFLADATGKPYAQTGYLEGGPQAYLDHLAELKTQK